MAKWENETAKRDVLTSRHRMFEVVIISLSVAFVFLGGIGGCTAYNIEKVKHPVEINESYDRNFERGNK